MPLKWTRGPANVSGALFRTGLYSDLSPLVFDWKGEKKAQLELNGAVVFSRRGHCPPADDRKTMDIDYVP